MGTVNQSGSVILNSQIRHIGGRALPLPFPFPSLSRKISLPNVCWAVAVLCSLTFSRISAQSYEKLNALKGSLVTVYFSPGADAKAKRMVEQIDRVLSFYKKHIGFSPAAKLLVLSPDDWSVYTRFPVYGMPHYGGNQTLYVAAEDNPFWQSFIPPPGSLSGEYARRVREVYADKNGDRTMEPFFDLLAIHELGHAFHLQDSLVMQRKWMGELFANILLHTYIAEMEPMLLPALTLFPEMVVATTDKAALKYTSLEDLEKNYNELGERYPRNYGWYQCRWHVAARKIYDDGGLKAFKDLWVTLKSQPAILDDPAFVDVLTKKVHRGVADVPLKWNSDGQ